MRDASRAAPVGFGVRDRAAQESPRCSAGHPGPRLFRAKSGDPFLKRIILDVGRDEDPFFDESGDREEVRRNLR